MQKKHLLWLIILYLTLFNLQGQTTFSKRFDLGLHSVFFTSIEAIDNQFIISSVVTDTLYPYKASNAIVIIDEEGNIINKQMYRDTNTNIEAWGKDIKTEDLIIKTGYTFSDQMRALLFAYDHEGSISWEVQQTGFFDSTTFFLYKDVLEFNNKLFAIGYSRHVENLTEKVREIVISTYSLEGELLNYYIIETPNWRNSSTTIIPLNDSLLLIGGGLDNLNRTSNNFSYHSKIWAIDTSGNLKWQWSTFSTSPWQLQQGIKDMLVTEDGGIVIATAIGTEIWVNASSGELRWDCYIYKLNSDLEQEWGTYFRHNVPSPIHQFNKIIAVADGSGFVAVGRSSSYFPDADPETENAVDIGGIIAKVSPQGDSLWSRIIIHPDLISFTEWHHFYDIEETSDGGFIMVGESRSSDTIPQQQGWLLKVDEWGCLVPGCHLISATAAASEPEINLLLYPNPAHEVLNVYLAPYSLTKGSSWRIYNAAGQEVMYYWASQSDATYVMELDKLPKGLYFLQLKDGRGETLARESFVLQ